MGALMSRSWSGRSQIAHAQPGGDGYMPGGEEEHGKLQGKEVSSLPSSCALRKVDTPAFDARQTIPLRVNTVLFSP